MHNNISEDHTEPEPGSGDDLGRLNENMQQGFLYPASLPEAQYQLGQNPKMGQGRRDLTPGTESRG